MRRTKGTKRFGLIRPAGKYPPWINVAGTGTVICVVILIVYDVIRFRRSYNRLTNAQVAENKVKFSKEKDDVEIGTIS